MKNKYHTMYEITEKNTSAPGQKTALYNIRALYIFRSENK